MFTRRQLLQGALCGVPAVAIGASLPHFLARTALAAVDPPPRDDRILVVVELAGGNDGLNMVVPYGDDLYHKARPTLRIPPREVVRYDDYTGLNPRMRPLENYLCDGRLAIVQGVGYPHPNRSHFESMDVWHSGDASRAVQAGWLGQALAQLPPVAERIPALHLGEGKLPLALQGAPGGAPTIHPAGAYGLHLPAARRRGRDKPKAESDDSPGNSGENPPPDSPAGRMRFIRELTATPGNSAGLVDFVRQTSLATYATVDRLNELLVQARSSRRSSREGLGHRLDTIASMIDVGLGARVYFTSLDGFDTHGSQRADHDNLLAELAEAMSGFFDSLNAQGNASRVALMTFSEFGRRVAENDSQGTDHGAASAMFLAGPHVQGGLVGASPSLSDLDDGDIVYHTDFRRVYATVLEDWLGCDSQTVLGQKFDKLPLFRQPAGGA